MIERAFRWRPTRWAIEERDLMRVSEGEVVTLRLANGSEDGWSVCWPEGSRLVLDLVEEGGLQYAMRAFAGRARALVPDDPELEGAQSAKILTVEIEGDTLRAAWVGADQLFVIRDGDVVARSRPHTLREELLAAGHPAEIVAKAPPVLSNYVGATHRSDFGEMEVRLEARDRVVLASHQVARALGEAKIAAMTAEQMVAEAFEDAKVAYAAAITWRA